MELKSKDTEKVVKKPKVINKTNVNKKKLYISTIEASTGTVTDVARRLNITHGSVSLYLDKHPDLRLLLDDKRMSNVQLAEDVLFEHLHKGTPVNIRQDSAKYITGRLGKKQGWVEKQEIGVSNTNNLTKEQMDEIIARLKK
ncbi:MAG: hypothetical protein QQN49_06145 [Nitrosopumilus sp.]